MRGKATVSHKIPWTSLDSRSISTPILKLLLLKVVKSLLQIYSANVKIGNSVYALQQRIAAHFCTGKKKKKERVEEH